jgi:hypothetical protein
MEKKQFDDDFLENLKDEKVSREKNIDFEELRLNSEGLCEPFFYQMAKCKGNLNITRAELCDKLRVKLLECLKSVGKYYE